MELRTALGDALVTPASLLASLRGPEGRQAKPPSTMRLVTKDSTDDHRILASYGSGSRSGMAGERTVPRKAPSIVFLLPEASSKY